MIVYGDPSFHGSLHELISRLRQRASFLGALTGEPEKLLDCLREFLIEAGEIEQAGEDEPEIAPHLLDALRATADRAAEAFHAVLLGVADFKHRVDRALCSIDELLELAIHQPDVKVRVKTPEGFALYTLFPEQYVVSSGNWAAEQGDRRAAVIVIGVRSIGTTLSAVVRAALNAAGRHAHRITVRPSGHPFDRRVDLNPGELRGAEFAIVVDEGPGASGSSMASVARGLVDAGFDPSRITFLPGHGGEPGPHAPADVRRWWSTTRRYLVPLSDLRWSGRSLTQKLVERTERLLPQAVVEQVDDLSGGLWQDVLCSDAEPKPAAFPAFERTKYRCTLRDGCAVLWKFVGLGADAEKIVGQIASRADAGWTSRPMGRALGFVGLPWIEGRALSRRDLSPELLLQVGRYIRDSAGDALSMEEQSSAFERLRETLYWNSWESLGDEAAKRSRELSDVAARVVADQPTCSYGDGRLGPQEWIRTPTGSLQKVDCAGHDCDHTMVGRQPLMWDVAGAVIEWQLDGMRAAQLVNAIAPRVAADLVRFYCAAYAAFRVGMAAMCGMDSTFFLEQLKAMLGQ